MAELRQVTLPAATSLPINGFGGSYYQLPFYIPVYNHDDPGVYNMTSFADIDYWSFRNINTIVTESICLGMCITTLAYVIALTPAKKRGRPFHSSLIIALVSEILRFVCDIARASKPGASQFSAYLQLSNDYSDANYSTSFRAAQGIIILCNCLVFLFTSFCLYIQSVGLLSGFQIKRPYIYKAIILYLVTAAAVAMVWRIVFAVYQMLFVLDKISKYSFQLLHQGTLTAYAISIGSWSLVSMVSVSTIILNRARMVMARNHLYDTALNLIALVCIESFLLPLVFSIIQLIPDIIGIVQPEHIVLPSVLVLLPLGSLFMTVHTARETPTTTDGSANTNARRNHLRSHHLLRSEDISAIGEDAQPARANSSLSNATSKVELQPLKGKPSAFSSPVDRELDRIDAMDDDEEQLVGAHSADAAWKHGGRQVEVV